MYVHIISLNKQYTLTALTTSYGRTIGTSPINSDWLANELRDSEMRKLKKAIDDAIQCIDDKTKKPCESDEGALCLNPLLKTLIFQISAMLIFSYPNGDPRRRYAGKL